MFTSYLLPMLSVFLLMIYNFLRDSLLIVHPSSSLKDSIYHLPLSVIFTISVEFINYSLSCTISGFIYRYLAKYMISFLNVILDAYSGHIDFNAFSKLIGPKNWNRSNDLSTTHFYEFEYNWKNTS